MRDDDDLRRLERQRSRLGAKPVALRPLPYGHPLGPTGTAPKTFGHCGGGLRNNVWATNVTKWEKDVIAETAKQFGHHGWSLVGRRPLVPWDTNWRLVGDSNAQRKQRSRITANDRKPH